MKSIDYIVVVSNDGRNWGQSHHAMGSYNTLEAAQEVASRAVRLYSAAKIMKQTTVLEEV